MTVLPSSATRSALAGTCARLAGATLTTLPARTTMVALSIGGRSVPSITRAPVKALTAPPEGDCATSRTGNATAAVATIQFFMRNTIAEIGPGGDVRSQRTTIGD